LKLREMGMGYERGSDWIHEIVMVCERGNVRRNVMDFRPFLDRTFWGDQIANTRRPPPLPHEYEKGQF
jgi:hypothetical protein